MRSPVTPAVFLALALPLAAAAQSSGAAPAPRGAEAAEAERQAEGLLSVIDVPATAARWRALGQAAVPRLVAVANDPGALPSRRAGALEGLAAIGGPEARVALVERAQDEGAPWSVRASALGGAGRLLPPSELMATARPVLERSASPAVRATAARVLAERAGAAGCDAVRAQAAREGTEARPRFDDALARCQP